VNDRLVRALRGQPVDRAPIWFMRQAGRYLPEYREVRGRTSFLGLCADADLASEVTLQPVRRFGLDAAIIFSDILVVLQAMGREVVFEAGEGPRVVAPVRTEADVRSLRRPDVADALPTPPETIRRVRASAPGVPVLGFAGAPFTLLCYLVEGSGSREWVHAKRLLWSAPNVAQRLLDLLADVVGDHLESQARAGAAAVQMFDTWAGILTPEDYARFALPAAARALARVHSAPRIYYTRDTAPFLDVIAGTGADAFGLDWRVDIARARRVLGERPVQGNLDPVALFAPEDEIRRRVRAILDAAGPVGHIFNLGHGILPDTPLSGVEAMVDEVKRSTASPRVEDSDGRS
jgi:uroporphyrinogen decarboxylase